MKIYFSAYWVNFKHVTINDEIFTYLNIYIRVVKKMSGSQFYLHHHPQLILINSIFAVLGINSCFQGKHSTTELSILIDY
jgi:hypothetical protein